MSTRHRSFRVLFLGAFSPFLALAPAPGAHAQSPDPAALTANLSLREIGPAIMGGRITNLAVNEANPAHFFVGTATGGLWKTTSAGQAWEPVFDDQPTSSIGAVAMAPSNPNVVWVGTGEPQNRQSSPYGAGVFRSTDGGRTWQSRGLEDTRHIARVVIHPRDPDVVYVAAVGHLWGPNPERGVYRTADGGETWERVLYIDDDTGVIDLVMDPADPKTLFAATYQRRRTAWGFSADGPGSGIHRTTDGGGSWTELTEGLPEGYKGRIGLDVYRRDGNLVYAIIESRSGKGRGIYRSLDRGETWDRVSQTNPRPMYFSLLRIDPNDPERIYIGGVRLGISDDGAKTFRAGDGADGIHVDHHDIWIDPANSDHLLLGSDGGLAVSWDRAEHWRQIDNLALGQFYEIGVSMEDPYAVCGGLQDNSSWCAPNDTRSGYGIRNGDWVDVSGGDGFYNKIDPTNPDVIYTESQGGNISRYDRRTGQSVRMRPVARPDDEDEDRSYRFNWNAPIHVSAHDPNTVYIGANHLLRSRNQGATWEEASPDLTRQIDRDTLLIMGMPVTDSTLSRNDGISTYGNITTIAESPFTGDLLYVGTDDGNLQRTRDGGATWTDLTGNLRGLPERTYVSSVIASAAEGGRVYATFDGHRNDDYRPYVYVSEDHGDSWQPIASGLPDLSVNRIREHPHTPDLLFLGNEVGAYFSLDRGGAWHRLEGNLPTVPVDDIVIHPRDNDLILGTHGRSIWILDDLSPFQQWSDLRGRMAAVLPVGEVTRWHRAGGWPFWGDEFQGDNPPEGATIRYYLSESAVAATVATAEDDGSASDNGSASDDRAATGSATNGRATDGPASNGDGPSRRSDRAESDDEVRLEILDAAGETVRTLEITREAGLHEVSWDLRTDPPYEPEGGRASGGGGRFGGPPRGMPVMAGRYTAALTVRDERFTADIQLDDDPRVTASAADLEARQQALHTLYELAEPVYLAGRRLGALEEQVRDARGLIEGRDDLPTEVSEAVDSLEAELEAIREDLGPVQRASRLGFAIEGSATRPTDDQTWQIEKGGRDAEALIQRLNRVIETDMPALYDLLNEHGVRPDPGKVVPLPRRSGGP